MDICNTAHKNLFTIYLSVQLYGKSFFVKLPATTDGCCLAFSAVALIDTMPNIPRKTLIHHDDIFGSREIHFSDRRDSTYSQLMRLCIDFDFSVLQLQRKVFSHLTQKVVPNVPEFVLATRGLHDNLWYAATPGLASLIELDRYAKLHEIDILHDYLFGGDEIHTADFNGNTR